MRKLLGYVVHKKEMQTVSEVVQRNFVFAKADPDSTFFPLHTNVEIVI